MAGAKSQEIDLAFAGNHALRTRVRAAIDQNATLGPLFHDVLRHLNKQEPQPPQLSAEDEDKFLASFEDEEEFLAASEAVENGKKRAHDDDSAESALMKRPKTELSPSTMLANRVLKEHFGLGGFRLKQEAAIARLLDGGSATIVFPTGGGKSLCYQVCITELVQACSNKCRFRLWHFDIRTRLSAQELVKTAASRWSSHHLSL